MTDTQWADVSQFNPEATDQYKLRGIAVRANDGNLRDTHVANNLAFAKHACDTGKMDFFLVYVVYEPNWQETLATLKAVVGTPHPKMAVMIDMESWGGRLSGDQSLAANALRNGIAAWLGSYMSLPARLQGKHYKRVIGYGNAADLANLWGKRDPKMWIVLANYASNPAFPGKLAHQYSDKVTCDPFGPCDMNSADGYTPAMVVKALGLDATLTPRPDTANPQTGTWRDATGHYSLTFDVATGHLNVWRDGTWVRTI